MRKNGFRTRSRFTGSRCLKQRSRFINSAAKRRPKRVPAPRTAAPFRSFARRFYRKRLRRPHHRIYIEIRFLTRFCRTYCRALHSPAASEIDYYPPLRAQLIQVKVLISHGAKFGVSAKRATRYRHGHSSALLFSNTRSRLVAVTSRQSLMCDKGEIFQWKLGKEIYSRQKLQDHVAALYIYASAEFASVIE